MFVWFFVCFKRRPRIELIVSEILGKSLIFRGAQQKNWTQQTWVAASTEKIMTMWAVRHLTRVQR